MSTIIETKRTILRKFVEDDIEAVYEFNSNKEVQKFTGDELITSLAQARVLITQVSQKDYDDYGYGRWALYYKPDRKVIGFAGLKYLPEIGETDIGFRFLPAYWGKGLATEVSVEIIKYGFDTLGLDKIIGIAMPENIASCKVLKKIGLTFDKVDGYDGDDGNYNWYSIDKNAYAKMSQ